MAKQSKTKKEDIWSDEHLAEQPAKTSKAVVLSERWIRVIRTYTKMSVWAFPVVAVVVLSLWSNASNAVETPPVVITNQVDTAGKSAAILAVNSWMSSKPAPLNGGQIIAWNGFDVKDAKPVPAELERDIIDPTYEVEIHHFTLSDAQGYTYLSDVAVAVDEVEGTSAVTTPSLSPVMPSADNWATSGTWYGLQAAPSTDAITVAIDQWARAFASGDPAVLRSIVGDGDATHSYMPLYGVSGVTTQFIAGGSVPKIVQGAVSDDPATTIIAQVRLQLTWTDAPAVGIGQGTGDSTVTYDLLINGADTAAPVVVAWGGPGSGTTLAPYDQAIIDRSIEQD
jgi:hypothetical protein